MLPPPFLEISVAAGLPGCPLFHLPYSSRDFFLLPLSGLATTGGKFRNPGNYAHGFAFTPAASGGLSPPAVAHTWHLTWTGLDPDTPELRQKLPANPDLTIKVTYKC